MDGQNDPNNRAERVGGVHLSDRRLAPAAAQEGGGDEWQSHAGAECGRQHDERSDQRAGSVEQAIARFAAREALHQRFHQREGRVVER